MTTVKFYKKNEIIYKLEVSGHTGFGQHGFDTLCAAISAIVQAGALGLQKVAGIAAKVEKDDDKGYINIELPSNLSNEQVTSSQVIFNTILEGVKDLQTGYSKHIKLEVK